MKSDKKRVVSVGSFGSVMEAQIYKALLESAGIQSRMQNDIAAQVMPAYGNLMEVYLLVAEEDEAKAKEVLKAKFDKEEFKEDVKASGKSK